MNNIAETRQVTMRKCYLIADAIRQKIRPGKPGIGKADYKDVYFI